MATIYEPSLTRGLWLKGFTLEDSFVIDSLLRRLEDSLGNVGLALTMFERQRTNTEPVDPLVTSLPRVYQTNLCRLYANEFIYELDGIDKVMHVLKNSKKMPIIPPAVRSKIAEAGTAFNTQLSGLNSVRNSLHHVEDRIRRKAKHEEDFTPQPIAKEWISSAGDTLILSSLNGNVLGCTAHDGSFQEVEISETTYSIAEKTVQAVLDSFEWMTVADQLRHAQQMGRLGGDISQVLSGIDKP